MKKVSIFGSCVTRDVFRVSGVKDVEYNYHARTSVISQMSTPLLELTDRINLESEFQKRMVINDFQKNFIQSLSESDILIIDFIDERFDLVRYDNSIVTRSAEFVRSGLEETVKFERIPRYQESTHKLWEDSLEEFVNQLLSAVTINRIVLHEAYWSNMFINQDRSTEKFDNPAQIEKNNIMLRRYYDKFKSICPGIKVVSSDPIGDVCHVWGKSPVHYTDEYYLDIYRQLRV